MIDGEIENVTSSNESEHGFNGSYVFDAMAKLTVPQHAALQKQNNIGFGLKVKPQSSGSIVNFTASGQKLSLLADNKFQYQVTTTDGSYQIESEVVDLDTWHTVGVRYQQGELTLEVNGKTYTAIATGNLLTSNASSTAIVIGAGFSGLANNFRVTDWDYPLLATLPNGSYEMEVTFTSENETVRISSTNKLGTRPMGYTSMQGIGNGIFAQAHANDFFNSFIGEITFQAQAINYALVETAKWSVDTTKGFALGLLVGDTSTTAGVIGDITMGFIPLGDARDIGLHEWYLAHNTLDANGKPKYDETILYLSYIGLGADALMLSPAAPLGAVLNGIVATIKPAMKLINGMPGKKVLGAKFKEMALAARDRDWTRFKTLSENMLPFMELFAAVAIDEELRNLLIGAVRNTTDLDNWTKYLTGFAQQADLVVHHLPLPSYLFDEAYAATSGFKLVLIEFLDYSKKQGFEDAGALLADAIGGLTKAIDNNNAISAYAYKTEAIKAMGNMVTLGRGSLDDLREFGHVSAGLTGAASLKRIDDMMLAIGEVDFKVLINKTNNIADVEGLGITNVMKGISHTDSGIAKGSAFQLIAINKAQKSGKLITGIEAWRHIIINGQKLRSRRYDYIEKIGAQITNVECKAWLPKFVAKRVKQSLKGTAEHGEQLMVDLLDWQKNNFKGTRWEFDSEEAVDIFKSTVKDTLRKDENIREIMSGHLGIAEEAFDEIFLDKAIAKLDEFVQVVN